MLPLFLLIVFKKIKKSVSLHTAKGYPLEQIFNEHIYTARYRLKSRIQGSKCSEQPFGGFLEKIFDEP